MPPPTASEAHCEGLSIPDRPRSEEKAVYSSPVRSLVPQLSAVGPTEQHPLRTVEMLAGRLRCAYTPRSSMC